MSHLIFAAAAVAVEPASNAVQQNNVILCHQMW